MGAPAHATRTRVGPRVPFPAARTRAAVRACVRAWRVLTGGVLRGPAGRRRRSREDRHARALCPRHSLGGARLGGCARLSRPSFTKASPATQVAMARAVAGHASAYTRVALGSPRSVHVHARARGRACAVAGGVCHHGGVRAFAETTKAATRVSAPLAVAVREPAKVNVDATARTWGTGTTCAAGGLARSSSRWPAEACHVSIVDCAAPRPSDALRIVPIRGAGRVLSISAVHRWKAPAVTANICPCSPRSRRRLMGAPSGTTRRNDGGVWRGRFSRQKPPVFAARAPARAARAPAGARRPSVGRYSIPSATPAHAPLAPVTPAAAPQRPLRSSTPRAARARVRNSNSGCAAGRRRATAAAHARAAPAFFLIAKGSLRCPFGCPPTAADASLMGRSRPPRPPPAAPARGGRWGGFAPKKKRSPRAKRRRNGNGNGNASIDRSIDRAREKNDSGVGSARAFVRASFLDPIERERRRQNFD